MPHNHQQLDSVTMLSSLMAGTVLATTTDSYSPIEVFPLSAGLSGAMLSVLRGRSQKDPKESRAQLISSFLCGVVASLFLAPFVVHHLLPPLTGNPDLATRTIVHLVVGLSGTTIIDWLLDHRKKMIATGARKILGEKFQQLADSESSPAVCEVSTEETPSPETPPTETHKPPVE